MELNKGNIVIKNELLETPKVSIPDACCKFHDAFQKDFEY
jgi:hypothetical protein